MIRKMFEWSARRSIAFVAGSQRPMWYVADVAKSAVLATMKTATAMRAGVESASRRSTSPPTTARGAAMRCWTPRRRGTAGVATLAVSEVTLT